MNIISGIGESGFLAHSAFSAGIATKDSNGNDITATYLTGVDLTPYQTTAGMTAYANSAEVTGTAQYGLTTAGWSEITGGGGGVTGDFELKEGNGIQLTDDPTAHTTTISVSGDYATNTQLQNVSAEITGMVPSIVESNTISYSAKPTADPIYASGNDLKNVNSIQGRSNLALIPSAVLQVPGVITVIPNYMFAVQNAITVQNSTLEVQNAITACTSYLKVPNVITAVPNHILNVPGIITANRGGLFVSGISADNGGFSAFGITAGKRGPLFIEGEYESIYANNNAGFTFSSQNTAFGTAQLSTAEGNRIAQIDAPKFEARNISGAGFSIEASGAKGYDKSGNVVWDTYNPQVKNIISYSDTKTAQGGLSGNIILTVMPSIAASNLTSTPYVIMDAEQASYFAAYGPSARTPTVKIVPGTITLGHAPGNTKTTVCYNDVKQELSGSSWTLTGSIQKRELEYDTATSAITAIAGSAIGGGGELPESVPAATDYVTANSANIDATVSNVSANSGAWGGSALPISAGHGIALNLVDGVLVISTAGE